MLIALYSSRVLLQYLGIDDFGLYGLIGSIIAVFTSLKSTFAASVQRFLNVNKEESIANLLHGDDHSCVNCGCLYSISRDWRCDIAP